MVKKIKNDYVTKIVSSCLPVVGSSQNRNDGSVRSSVANDTIFLSPPDNVVYNIKYL